MKTILLVVHALFASTAIVASILGVQARTFERARHAASILLVVVLIQTFVGDVLYPFYLRNAKPALRTLTAGSRSVADVFEVKEHLAFFVLVFTIGVFVLTRRERKPSPIVRLLFGGAHGGIILVATLGLVIASLRTP